MNANFRKYRIQSRFATAFMVLAAVSFFGFFFGFLFAGAVLKGIAPALVLLFVLGGVAVALEWAAYDNLICPKCWKRIVKPLREAYTKENRALHRAIDRGEEIACVHCGSVLKTA